MIIERSPIPLVSLNFSQIKIDGFIVGTHSKDKFLLDSTLLEYLEFLISGKSIYEISQIYLQKNILISFKKLYDLLVFLSEEGFVKSVAAKDYLLKPVLEERARAQEQSLLKDIYEALFGSEEEIKISIKKELKENAFFRSLSPEIFQVFTQHAKGAIVPKNIAICRQGTDQKSLYVLLRGQASVFKTESNGRRQRIATLRPGSVFGETGFFLQEPRTADVITDEESVIVRIRHNPEIFDNLIKTEKARQLQMRFWMIHALLRSNFFKNLPSDCFDSLLFSGEFKNMKSNDFVIRENEMGNSCYILVQGKAQVIKGGKTIRTLDQGDCFGEIALVLSQGRRTASVQLTKDSVIVEIPAKNFYHILSENIVLASQLELLAHYRSSD